MEASTNEIRLVDRPGLCKILIAASAFSWGASFFVLKDVIAQMPVFFVLATRFSLAALFIGLVFWKRIRINLNKPTILFGLKFGVLGFIGYAFQTFGLLYTSPGKNAFLTGCYCILVPFFTWMIGLGRPKPHNILGVIMCVIGLGFVVLDGGLPLNKGDVLSLVCTFAYAMQYAILARDGGDIDTFSFTAVQFVVMAACSLGATLMFEELPGPETFTVFNLAAIVALALICSSIAFIAVNHAFTRVDPASGALLSSLEAPIGVFFSIMFAGEVLTGRAVLGFVLIFCAVLVSELGPATFERIPVSGAALWRRIHR